MKKLVAFALSLLSFSALAEEISITRSHPCQAVRASGDPSYRADVDVHGRDVASADLNPSVELGAMHNIEVPLGVPVKPYVNNPHLDTSVTTIPVGTLEVRGEESYLDGQLVNPDVDCDAIGGKAVVR
ncbi:MAG: hypothetical protein J0L97_10410 [Alphaproteobacteria bacterium]|nr:hypothetical protein [Alphaproteobacteria bacterium]